MFFWLVPLVVIACITVPLVVADVTSFRLPNRLLLIGYTAFGVAAELTTLQASPSGEASPVLVCCITLAGAVALRVLGAVGMGDVKLAGLLAGTLQLVPNDNGPPLVIAAGVTLFLVAPAALIALAYGKRAIPLGPVLLAAFWSAVLV